jgi:hypothetical protein
MRLLVALRRSVGWGLFPSLDGAPPEGVQHPIILYLLVAKNVKVAVVGQNLETLVANAIPLIQDLFDFQDLPSRLVSNGEPQGPFIRLVARVTFDLEMQTHRTSKRLSF